MKARRFFFSTQPKIGNNLAILTNHSADKIKIFGQWESIAFLNYIQQQVTQWSSCFTKDMVCFKIFFGLYSEDITKR